MLSHSSHVSCLRQVPKVLGATSIALVANLCSAQVVATCSEPEGYGYYHHRPPVSKKDSGFRREKISGGLTTLRRLDSGEYDILYVDAQKQPMSSRQDGGTVLLLRRGTHDATFLVAYPGRAIQLYTFYVDVEGDKRFDLLQSKGGDEMLVHYSSVMTGLCSELHLDLLK